MMRREAVVGLVLIAVIHGCANGGELDEGNLETRDGAIDGGRTGASAADDAGMDAGSGDAGVEDATAPDACAAALAAIPFGFDTDAQGWTHGVSDGAAGSASWPFDGWTRGTATSGTACPSGSCFGAELGQNYAQCERGYLLSPAIDLSACAGRNVVLTFQHAHAFWTGTYNAQTWYDGGVVEVSTDGQTWQVPPAPGVYSGTVKINPDKGASYACTLPSSFGADGKQGFVGSQTTTTKISIPLPTSSIAATTRIRFSMASGVSSQTTSATTSRQSTGFGWRIDDVSFELQ